MSRLSKINKKFITLAIVLMTLLAMAGTFIYIAFKDPSVIQVVGKESSEARYVLVNEDDGWEFEGKNYQLGSDFVTFISQDEKNKWATSNRSQAKAGIGNGEYDAMIVIPKNFSQTVLSLQSIDPQKANIEYRIRNGQNQVTQQVIEKNINNILYNFNTRIVQMYFSSIVASLSDAQQSVTGMVDTESQFQNYLKTNIQTPFQSLPQSFKGASTLASSLQSRSSAVETEQKSFVSSVTSLLNGNADEVGGVADSLSSGDKESNDGTNKGSYQFGELDNFYAKMTSQLTLLGGKTLVDIAQTDGTDSEPKVQGPTLPQTDEKDTTKPKPSIYERFLENAKKYENAQTLARTSIETNIKKLETQINSLKSIQQVIALNYYGDSKLTPETATIENAKEAIATLMSPDKSSKLDKDYLTQLNTEVNATPTSSLVSLINALVSKNVISEEQANEYRNELILVNRYSSDFGVGTGTTSSYNFVNREDPTQSNIFQTTATFNIATNGDTISLSGEGVAISNSGTVATQIQTSLNQQLAPYGKEAVVSASSGGFGISIRTTVVANTSSDDKPANQGTDKPAEEGQGKDASQDGAQSQTSKAPVAPTSLPVTVSVELAWSPQHTDRRSYQEVDYQWTNSNGGIASGKLAVFDAKNDTIVQDLPTILNNFSSLDKAAQQITTIFSNPAESIATFAQRVQNSASSLADLAGSNSIYYRYNNIDKKELAKSVSNEFAGNYKKDGDYLYNELNKQVTELTNVLGSPDSSKQSEADSSLYGLLKSLPSKDEYYNLVVELGQWYDNTKETLDKFYKSDTTSRTEQEVANNSRLESAATQLRNIQKSAKDITKQTESTASDLPKMDDLVQSFTTDANQLEQEVSGVLENVNKYASNTDSNLSDNQKYSEAFNKVLANTKNGGADNAKVFNFLSSPIEVSAIRGSTAKVSIIPYYMTIVSALLTISISFFTIYLIKPRKLKEGDKLQTPTRIWYNLPNTAKIVSIALVASLAFATITSSMLQSVSKLVWVLYTFLLLFILINLFVYLLRKFDRTITLYFFTFLLGIYLLLMPIIGSSTKPGTMVSLLYRFSPFQNIENGYVALMNGINVSFLTIFALILVALVVTSLNLFIKPNKTESV